MAEDNVTESPFTRDSLPQTFDFFNRSPVGSITGGLPSQASAYTKAIEPTPPPDKSVEDFGRRMQEVNKAVSSPWPTILSIAAALKGDFRPAMMLDEQKRKTAIGLKLTPLFQEPRKKAIQGDTEGAQNMLNEMMGQYSGRAPEFAQLAGKASEEIAKKTQQLQTEKNGYNMIRAMVEDRPELEPMYRSTLRLMKYNVDSKIPMGKEVFDPIMQHAKLDTTLVGERVIERGPGGFAISAARPVTTPGELNSITGNRLMEAHKLSPQEAQAVLNGQDVITAEGGRRLLAGSPEAEAVKRDWVKLRPVAAMEEASKLAPITPEQVEQQLKLGTHPTDIALRNLAPGEISTGLQGIQQQRYELAAAATRVALTEDPTKMPGAGMVLVDLTPNARDFGTNRELEARTFADFKRLEAQGKQLGYVNREAFRLIMAPGVQGLRDLQTATDMLASVKNPDGVFEQGASAVTQRIAQTIGYAIQPGMTYRQVARVLMERGINQAEIGTQNSQLVNEMKSFVTGPMLTAKDMKEVRDSIDVFQRRILDNIRTNTGAVMSVEDFQKTYQPPTTPTQMKAPPQETKGAKGSTPPSRAAVQKKIQSLREQGVPIPEKGEYQGQGVMKGGKPAKGAPTHPSVYEPPGGYPPNMRPE
jgi:hypothetical protein